MDLNYWPCLDTDSIKSIYIFNPKKQKQMKNKKPTTQKEQVLIHLQKKSLTMPDAVALYNIYRLASIIHSLKDEGHKIKSVLVPFKSRFGHSGSFSKYILQK